jgi:hypothetical protein
MPRKSDLPFGSEFSPSNVDLKTVLEFAKQHGGDWKKFEAAVHDRFFSPKSFPKTSEYNRRKRANNTKLGLQAYQIIDDDARLTPFGEELYEFRNNEPALYEALARHILLNLHGAALVQTILDIQSSGEKVDLVKLRQWMEDRGVHFPRGGKHPSMMRLWLEKAGVFLGRWRVDEERLKQLTGPIGAYAVPLRRKRKADVSLEVRRLMRLPMRRIVEAVDSDDKSIRRLALEAFAIRLMKINRLHCEGTGLLGKEGDNDEVDLVFESTRPVFSRWYVHCRKAPRLQLDELAKRCGFGHSLKSSVIVIISAGAIDSRARQYADALMKDTNLCFVMIDRNDMQRISSKASAFPAVLSREARRARVFKSTAFAGVPSLGAGR